MIGAALLQKAARLNRCHRVWLGWEADEERIARYLTGSASPTESDFVQAVAHWQDHKKSQPGAGDLKVDGILGLDSMRALYAEMSLPLPAGTPPSGPPPRPAWVDWIESPNHLSRMDHPITTIVIHATSGNQMSSAINGFLSGSPDGDKCGGTSAHYVIGRGGEVVQMVALDQAACHAGDPYNRFSIGIELVNVGQKLNRGAKVSMCAHEAKEGGMWKCKEWQDVKPVKALETYYRYSKGEWLTKNEYWVPYSEAQYTALVRLVRFLVSCIPTIQHITGHEHLSCWRKVVRRGKASFTKMRSDPGGVFDWPRLETALAGWFGGTICHQVDKYDKKTGKFRTGSCHLPVLKNLCS